MARPDTPTRAIALGLVAAVAGLGILYAALSPEMNGGPPLAGVEDEEELDALRALGYVDEASELPPDVPTGVLQRDPARSHGGIDFFVVASECAAYIASPDGEILRRWSHAPCDRWENGILTTEGEVWVIHGYPMPADATLPEIMERSTSLLHLDWDGALIRETKLPVHHDVGLTPDGRIAVLTRRLKLFPVVHRTIPVRDHGIAILSRQGELLEQAFLMDIIARSRDTFRPGPARFIGGGDRLGINAVHANSIEWMDSDELARKDPFYSKDNVLVTSRAQHAIWLIHWPTKKIAWAWGPGELHAPHDATVLANGHILVFDNGTRERGSRVVEMDPLRREIVWQYKGHDFYSDSRSSAQRLPSGNTLIAASNLAEAFEVTPSGEIVWRFRNPIRGPGGKPAAIVRIRNYEPDEDLKPRAQSD